jgi:hypothetical protein
MGRNRIAPSGEFYIKIEPVNIIHTNRFGELNEKLINV